MQVFRAVGSTIRAVEVVVAIVVKGAAEALCISVVNTGHPDGQAHPPIVHVGPDKGPGGKDQLREENHIQQLINIISSCSGSKNVESVRLGYCQNHWIPTVTFFPW